MARVISTDPRSWGVLSPTPHGVKARKCDLCQLWIRRCYIGLGNDVFSYLRRPRYLQVRVQGTEVALMPCGADERGARRLYEPKSPRLFYHLKFSAMSPAIRHGDYNNLRFRAVAGEPYVVFDTSF